MPASSRFVSVLQTSGVAISFLNRAPKSDNKLFLKQSICCDDQIAIHTHRRSVLSHVKSSMMRPKSICIGMVQEEGRRMKIVVQTDIRLACSNMLLWWESAETERTVQKSPRTRNWSQDYVGLVTKFLQSMIRHTLSSVSQSISQTDITTQYAYLVSLKLVLSM